MRLHLDTDFAGDTDDACALAMLLGWPEHELVGVTTTADPDGRRAGYVARFLDLAGRGDVPVAAGAGASLTTGGAMGALPDHGSYWPGIERPDQLPSSPAAAIELLAQSIDRGATIAAIGPLTNLALLEMAQPGRLRRAPIVLMGGWVDPPADGLPPWGPSMDWNTQCDTEAAMTVTAGAEPTLVTLPATLVAHLREEHLGRLAASGRLGELLAHQARAHAAEHAMATLGRAHPRIPDDLLNFQYDPIACAVAAGWDGARVEETRLRPVLEDSVLRFERADTGSPARVVVDLDGDGFADVWLSAVEAAQQRR